MRPHIFTAAGYWRSWATSNRRALYEKGIEVTGRTGDLHTRSELQAALDMLPI